MRENLIYELLGHPRLAQSLSLQIARELGRNIVSGKLAMDGLIPDEGALASDYNVSKTVVRDAVKVLVGKGMLEVRRGVGTRVRQRLNWDLLDDDVLAWHQSVPPSPEFLRQIMELRQMVEPRAAFYAAVRGTDEAQAAVKAAQTAMDNEKAEIEGWISADALFHSSVLKAANNELLRPLEGVIYSALLMSIRLTNKDPRKNETSLHLHRAVTEAILRRNGPEAEECMLALLTDAEKRLRGYMHDP